MQKLRKSTVIAVLTILIICIPYFFPLIRSMASQGVDVNVMPSPAIDIVLAKSKTQTDVTTFEKDLKEELINQGISSDRIKINAVEAVEANIQDSFSWETDVSSTVGSISITNAGQDIVMKGNKKNPGKNAIWIIPEKEQEQEIKFDYSVDFGDSFNAAGMLLRVKQTGDTLTGYMLSLNKSGKTWYNTAGKKYGAIWKFTYKIGTNASNMIKTFVRGLDIQTSGTLNIKSTDMKITISGGGLKSPIEYVMDTEYGHGFGFFSDHYSHNCSKIGAFKLGDIKLVTTTVKKFKEVLSNPEWRENSLRFLVNVDDYENKELQDKSSMAALESRLVNEEIHSIFWGTEQNEEQANKIIQGNNGNGIFTENTDYQEAIRATAEYIKNLINTSKTSQYAIVGEEVGLKVTPESVKNDTVTPDYPNGKWKINHDYKYFENDLGKSKNSGKYMSDLSMSFDKTGRYELLYGDEKIISKYIYVHRKPVANFNVLKQENSVNLTSTSYDLDSYSNNKGIAKEEWKYKKVEETQWTNGKLTEVEPNEVYMVQLKVQDFQETWSTPMTQYIMSGDEGVSSIPVADFTIKNSNISKYEDLQIEDTSYDPAGVNITERIWKVKKDDKVIYTGSKPLTNYKDYEAGTYTISLVVKNESGNSSEEFSRKIQVGEDTIPPTVDGTPDSMNWTNESVTVDLQFSDKGGSKIKGYQYQITDTEKEPTSWGNMISEDENSITINAEGEKYLHVIAHDNAGNVSEDTVLGPYKIDLSKPEVKSIVPEDKDWTNETVDIKATFSDRGGSGFSAYKYSVTTSKETPDNWSEKIKEDEAVFTISSESEQYLHIILYDNAGNVSDENIYGPYKIDKTLPKVELTPTFSDWTNKNVTVEVKTTDEGGSNFKKYKYAVTNSGTQPEEWKDEVIDKIEPIVLNKEGEHYIHLVGYDNAGNESSDYIFGKYKLDFTEPKLVQENQEDSKKFTAKDELSGISKFIVNGDEISETEYIVTKNGKYEFEILDYAGNKFTENVEIDDLNSECDKELGHPSYSSSYEKCPICDLIEGIEITENEKVYEGKPVGISYTNEKNAEIIEYYDNKLDKPSAVGKYNYELKIVYEEKQYNTGIEGLFILNKKVEDVPPVKDKDDNSNVGDTVDKEDVSKVEDKVNVPNTGNKVNTNKVNRNPNVNIQKNNKKVKKEKLLGTLPYTGAEGKNTLVIIAFIILIFNTVLGIKILSSGRNKEIEYKAKRYK